MTGTSGLLGRFIKRRFCHCFAVVCRRVGFATFVQHFCKVPRRPNCFCNDFSTFLQSLIIRSAKSRSSMPWNIYKEYQLSMPCEPNLSASLSALCIFGFWTSVEAKFFVRGVKADLGVYGTRAYIGSWPPLYVRLGYDEEAGQVVRVRSDTCGRTSRATDRSVKCERHGDSSNVARARRFVHTLFFGRTQRSKQPTQSLHALRTLGPWLSRLALVSGSTATHACANMARNYAY
jgi:hypothetical protein